MAPTFKDLKRYCDNNGWVMVRNTDHWYYEIVLADGSVLKTRVSDATHKEIPKRIWEKILKKQLQISEEDFWKGV
jgi:hypothetical protein